MYQSLIAILMLLSMLSHTLLGCGWHHAHDCHAGQASSCQTVALCGHQAEHAHHDHVHASHQPAEPAPEEQPASPETDPCQEGRCSYLASSSVKVLEKTSQFVSLLPAWDLLYSAQEKQYVDHMFQLASRSSIAAPGVRAQAQKTVWLL